ncbi:MAG TPA: DUF952 domain-containing protein [Acidimicrobiales bacterium]|nr:DUF952 domain-containing protein [Acidimicrobiales bacterium]
MPGAPGGARVFHLLHANAWSAQSATSGPIAVDQFERHGFVHCCFREQLVEIATWWFDPGPDDELVALELDPLRLTAELRLEASPSRWHPHLYGPIDAGAVRAAHPVPRDRAAGGRVRLPPAIADPPPGFQVTDRAGRQVRWRDGAGLSGDEGWIAAAHTARAEGRTVELIGGIVVPATLDTAYEAFALIEGLAVGGIARYDGDGFFPAEPAGSR